MCTCTEDKFLVVDNGIRDNVFNPELYVEIPYDGVSTSIFGIVGRNKIVCQECIDSQIVRQKQNQIQLLMAQAKELEGKIFYSQLDGETAFVNSKMAERAALN